MKHERVYIDGMTCINCQTRIWNALRSRTGITDVTVSYERSQAEFYYEPQDTTVYTGDGQSFDLHLEANEIRWYQI